MLRVVIVLVVVLVAFGVAELIRRRRPDAPTQPRTFAVPAQLDRADFEGGDREWLVAVFTSATCNSCRETLATASILNSDAVAVCEVEVSAHRDLHSRYGIEAVPMVLIADGHGVVRRSFTGPVGATHLWAAVAELRDPGSVPPDCTS